MSTEPYSHFVPLQSADLQNCWAGFTAVCTLEPHGPVVADADFACIHEHIIKDVPVYADCLARHAEDPLCCHECELGKWRDRWADRSRAAHCCPVMLTVRPR